MVLTEKIESGEVIFTGKKKYKRLVLKNGVEWRRFKTNHQVTKEQHDILEEMYATAFPSSKPHLVAAGVKKLDIRDDSDRKFLERNMVRLSDGGKSKLAAVKFVKENTGMGFKESKEYFENFMERKRIFNSFSGSTRTF